MNPSTFGKIAESTEFLSSLKAIFDFFQGSPLSSPMMLIAIGCLSLALWNTRKTHKKLKQDHLKEIRLLNGAHRSEIKSLSSLLATVAREHSNTLDVCPYERKIRNLFLSHRFREAVEHVLDQMKALIDNKLKFHIEDYQNDSAITLKVVIPRSMLHKVLPDLKRFLHTIPPTEEFVLVTFARDSSTVRATNIREVRKSLFTLSANAAFNSLMKMKKGEAHFACDNLKDLQGYFNQTPDWDTHYNATLVVPLYGGTRSDQGTDIKGFICIDSKNESLAKLYCRPEMHEMARLFSEILRTYFLACTGAFVPAPENKRPT